MKTAFRSYEPIEKKFLSTHDLEKEKYKNRLGLRVGQLYQMRTLPPWSLIRAGYRVTPADLVEDVEARLGTYLDGTRDLAKCDAPLRAKVDGLFGYGWNNSKKLRRVVLNAISYQEASAQNFGGPHRGIWLGRYERVPSEEWVVEVEALKSHVVGQRYVGEEGPALFGTTRVTFALISIGTEGFWVRTGDLHDAVALPPLLP